jgi:hypothetical protein
MPKAAVASAVSEGALNPHALNGHWPLKTLADRMGLFVWWELVLVSVLRYSGRGQLQPRVVRRI